MRKFLGIILSLVILASCASVKKIDYQMPLQVSLVKQIKTNNTFRMLWFDYITEANQYQSIKNYTPSEKLIAHYSLIKEKKNVIVPLLIQVDKEFDYKQLDNLGASYSKTSDEIISVRFPVKYLPSLLQMKNVSYIEYQNNVELRLY